MYRIVVGVYRIVVSEQSEPKKRIEWIDYCRGLAILMMIAGHSLGNTSPYIANFIFAVHMPIFFVLSGILLKEKYLHSL